tara:strand:- start:279 stop:1598 length:1320 start_codon:yes stop_codon:yes gene_type:complete
MGLLDSTTQQQYYDGNDHGNYQFTSLDNIISQFTVAYVGENKIIPKVSRVDVAFHAQRALQELSFDTLKSVKAQEVTVPATLQMTLPQDYVNYTKISWVDSAGIKHLLYPTSKTSNPSLVPLQDSAGDYTLTATGTLVATDATIVLDAEYSNIKVGMIVSGPNIDSGSTVLATSNSSSITTIEISNNATYSGTETLTFTNADDGSLILEEESTYILENVTWDISEDKITQSPNTDVSSITVGMLVSHGGFPIGTTVVDVNGAVITTSNISTTASTATTNEVTFISTPKNSTTWNSYKSATPSENQNQYDDDTYWPIDGSRFGLDPQHAQANGSFYIDQVSGKIHFSSNISGKTVILDYISDSLGTDAETQVHKFAEEAMYKWIAYAILSTSSLPIHQQLAPRFKKEKFAATRQAKLRLSNIKLEELTQILRGKSKQIKH